MAAPQGPARVGSLALRPHHEPDRLPQPARGAGAVGVGVFQLSAGGAPDHRGRTGGAPRVILRAVLRPFAVVLAPTAALIPPPPSWVERAYSTQLYPRLQNAVTARSNLV